MSMEGCALYVGVLLVVTGTEVPPFFLSAQHRAVPLYISQEQLIH